LGRYPVQGVLLTAYRIKNFEKPTRVHEKGLWAIDIVIIIIIIIIILIINENCY
jgi:hypothetical protein